MELAAVFVLSMILGISQIANGDTGYSVCASPPDIEGAVAPQLKGTEHPIDTAVIYNCPLGYNNPSYFNRISVCRYDAKTGRAQWTVPTITCNNKETADGRETQPVAAETKSLQLLNDKSNEDCFCTYDYEHSFLNAQIEGKTLVVGDTIRRGENVTFSCESNDMVLKWQNGLRLQGSPTMNCNTCKKWQRNDVPACKKYTESDAVISINERFDILPGGIAVVQKNKRIRVFCSSSWKFPEWDYSKRNGVSTLTSGSRISKGLYITLLYINNVENEHIGKYECYVTDDRGQRSGSTFLHLQVNDDHVTCPEFPYAPELNVEFSDYLSVGSVASFECLSETEYLNGSSSSVCQENGIWSNPLPSCIGFCKVPHIENGVMGWYKSIKTRGSRRYRKFFKTVLPGAKIDSHQTLLFRCINDALPVVDSRSISSNSLEVTCIDGEWSEDLECEQDQKCSLYDLASLIPESVEPDRTNVNEDNVIVGTELELKCVGKFLMTDDSKAYCERGGKWRVGNFKCLPDCILHQSIGDILANPFHSITILDNMYHCHILRDDKCLSKNPCL